MKGITRGASVIENHTGNIFGDGNREEGLSGGVTAMVQCIEM